MDIFKKLQTLGYDIEVLPIGITVILKGRIKFFGTEPEVLAWLKENGELE